MQNCNLDIWKETYGKAPFLLLQQLLPRPCLYRSTLGYGSKDLAHTLRTHKHTCICSLSLDPPSPHQDPMSM